MVHPERGPPQSRAEHNRRLSSLPEDLGYFLNPPLLKTMRPIVPIVTL